MKDILLSLLRQGRDFWGSLSVVRRISLVVVVLGVGLGVLGISYLASQQTYTYLFTELTPEDAGAIAAKLKELKVPYRVGSAGGAIEVPEERVHELRLELAGQGLPRGGGVGFEIFDKSHLGATEFEQRINLRRALEGELSRTIGNIAAVHGARVHLVMPEHSVFAMSKQEASASVVLKLRQGRHFGKAEVAGVVHLVASAVPGLAADRVSIVSTDGTVLHRPRTEGAAAGSLARDGEDREREAASSLEEQARAMLERVVGPGHADVRIGLSLDGASHERTEEHFEPAKTALRSEQKTEEHSAPQSESVAGVPGAASNLPDGTATPVAGPTTAGNGSRTSWTRNWEVDRVTERTTTPAGRVNRLTVAVVVDGAYKTTPGGREFTAREKPELDRLAELVKGAVGFSAERGDMLEIACAQFATAEAQDIGPMPTGLFGMGKKGLYILGAALGAFLLALVMLLSRRKKPARTGARLLGGAKAAELALAAGGLAPALPAAPRAEPEVVRSRALEIAAKDPATAAVILRAWLNAPSSANAGTRPGT
ncbi:MAG TPA: flagellar basal-body MS-ring/collar protein FliF [Polyangiaceae bacterium]|nr:flagellar basal-body MS-ring/collar protein FliF [Polyangiaceae bacterium]